MSDSDVVCVDEVGKTGVNDDTYYSEEFEQVGNAGCTGIDAVIEGEDSDSEGSLLSPTPADTPKKIPIAAESNPTSVIIPVIPKDDSRQKEETTVEKASENEDMRILTDSFEKRILSAEIVERPDSNNPVPNENQVESNNIPEIEPVPVAVVPYPDLLTNQILNVPVLEEVIESAPPRRKYVFCPTRLTRGQLAKLNDICQKCNGLISKEYTNEVTHLVINLERNRVPQTMKYLFAVADKKWVVVFDWIENCVKAGKMVDEVCIRIN
jgi:hypothetical protein